MDKTYQDIHIYNLRTHTERIIREATIIGITFNVENITIKYLDSNGFQELHLKKEATKLTID